MLVPQLAVRGIATGLNETRTAALDFSLCGLLIVACYSPAEGYKDANPRSARYCTSAEFFWRRAGEPLQGRAPKLSINFEEILSRAHWNFEQQSRVLEPSTITVNHSIIIINAHYNNITNGQSHCYICNKGPLKKCDKEEQVAVTAADAAASCSKADSKTFCPMSGFGPVTARPAPQR